MEAKTLVAAELMGPKQAVITNHLWRTKGALASGPLFFWLIGLLSIGVCLGFWQWASTAKWSALIHFENIPPPSEVASVASEVVSSFQFRSHVWHSVQRVFNGFSIASVLAVAIGLIVGRSRFVSAFFLPPLELLRPIPAVAWIPLAILLFSTSEQSIVSITFIGAFFPILLNTVHGVQSIDKRLIHASLSLGAGPFTIFTEIILPGALPSIFTGLSIGMGTTWFSLITAEMISGQFGIGYYTWEAYSLQNYASIILGMICIGILGTISSGLIRLVGRRLMPWFQSGVER